MTAANGEKATAISTANANNTAAEHAASLAEQAQA
jgi:hypothetical protein